MPNSLVFFKKNYTNAGRFSVSRGSRDISTLGQVMAFNGETDLDLYSEAVCDKWNGTDGLIFPPFLSKNEPIFAFVPDLCRSVGLQFAQDSTYEDVKTSRFELEIPGNGPKNCYCRDEDSCPPKGTMDLSICKGAPFIASNPHFYDADPELLRDVVGLSPVKEKHSTFGDFHLVRS